jgi:hypothetical protein
MNGINADPPSYFRVSYAARYPLVGVTARVLDVRDIEAR